MPSRILIPCRNARMRYDDKLKATVVEFDIDPHTDELTREEAMELLKVKSPKTMKRYEDLHGLRFSVRAGKKIYTRANIDAFKARMCGGES